MHAVSLQMMNNCQENLLPHPIWRLKILPLLHRPPKTPAHPYGTAPHRALVPPPLALRNEFFSVFLSPVSIFCCGFRTSHFFEKLRFNQRPSSRVSSTRFGRGGNSDDAGTESFVVFLDIFNVLCPCKGTKILILHEKAWLRVFGVATVDLFFRPIE